MAKRKVSLTDEQKRRNAEILNRIRSEEQHLFEDTRKLQQQWKSNSSRRRKARSRSLQ